MLVGRLLIGPLLRRVVGTRATVWVETSAPSVVTVRAAGGASGSAPTFSAYAHHYALVVVDGLAPNSAASYEVLIDDEMAWPVPKGNFPPSVIRTRAVDDRDQPLRLIFGSCRETTEHVDTRGPPPDALDAYARRLIAAPEPDIRPDLLILVGHQVYADVTSPTMKRLVKRRRGRPRNAPADQVVSFHEYCKLYLESWRDPEIRWLLSTVPSVMIFDDHEVIDDWNTSASWRADMRGQDWWIERIRSALASYWVYQHLGNLSPDEIAEDALYAKVVAAEDATDVLREFGERVDRGADEAHNAERWRAVQYQWSYSLDLGATRLIILDSRCSRVLEPGIRAMLAPGEWSWFLDRARGVYDHLVVCISLPWLLPPGLHHVESWNERLADSRRPWVARLAEQMRRAWDLEHWAAFRRSFDALGGLFARIGSGAPDATGDRVGAEPAYTAPASISVLSGDVHHSYVARARFDDPVVRTPVPHLTCSPIHNQAPAALRHAMKLCWNPGVASVARILARSVGVRPPLLRWTKLAGPYFGNAVATLEHRGRAAEVVIEGTTSDGHLREVARQRLVSVD